MQAAPAQPEVLGPPGTSADQRFCDLHGIQRRALQQLVSGGEDRDRAAAGITQVPADAAYEDIVAARCVDRHREVIAGDVVHYSHTGRRGKDLAYLFRSNRPLAFEGDRYT